jgi:hypothetical protein
VKKVSLITQVAVGILTAAASLSPALAQPSGPQLYAFHTGPNGGCPGLDWHVTVQGNKLEGFVAWDQMKHMARLNGNLIPAAPGKERTFKMDAQEVGGTGRKATVQGSAGGDYINASIVGSGTACDGKILPIPRVTGGTEGGGG